MCCAADVLEGRGLVQVAITVVELVKYASTGTPVHSVKSPTRYSSSSINNNITDNFLSRSNGSSAPSSPLI